MEHTFSRVYRPPRATQQKPVPLSFEKRNGVFPVFIGLPEECSTCSTFSETLYIDKKEVHRGRENFFIPYIMPYKSGTNGTMLLLPDKQGIFYVPLLKTKVEQDFTHLPVLPDKMGKFYVPLFELKSGTRTAPASCCTQTQDPSQPPAGRPIPASSGSEMRTCVPLLLSLTLSEAF